MKICLVSFGLQERNRRLQPWRYLLEAANVLAHSKHDVSLVSDGYASLSREESVAGLPVTRLATLHARPWRRDSRVAVAVNDLRPDVVLWNLALPSFLRLNALQSIRCPVIGVFTSPIYRPQEILRLGLSRLRRNYRLSAHFLLAGLLPGALVRRALSRGFIEKLVVECETTKARLTDRGVSGDHIDVIRPGIDPIWFESQITQEARLRVAKDLDFPQAGIVVAFFGSPKPLRGLSTLLTAVAMARKQNSTIRLLILSRRREDELTREQFAVDRQIGQIGANRWTHMITGFLPQERLVQILAGCDLIALPFEVVPSDVPLSVLEAMALGLPVITTEVACLPELVPDGAGLRVAPATPRALATAIQALASDEEHRLRLGTAARERARTWQASRQDAQSWDKLLKELV
jgi:glycosyltransferase involved in cell wall biosynthesis